MTIVAPSLLACDFSRIQAECKWLETSKATWLHLDIMDGVFVPNISFGVPVVQAIRKVSSLWLDTHLMIVDPHKYIDVFYKAGSQSLSIHVEASRQLKTDLQHIQSLGMQAGIAINPDTPAQSIFDMLEYCDLICLMSVYPGFGGQTFIESSLEKISVFKQFIVKNNLPVRIEVDGGVTLSNVGAIKRAGADIVVAGNTIFGAVHPKKVIEELLGEA